MGGAFAVFLHAHCVHLVRELLGESGDRTAVIDLECCVSHRIVCIQGVHDDEVPHSCSGRSIPSLPVVICNPDAEGTPAAAQRGDGAQG